MRKELTQERLKELLHYDPETGVFTWKTSTSNRRAKGAVAGSLSVHGYCCIGIDGKVYTAHRLAFLYMRGALPSKSVDHRNRDRADNRWCNLREASPGQNSMNSRMRSDNSTGYKGVVWDKKKRLYKATIKKGAKSFLLGYFDCPLDAAAAYNKAAAQLHGEFAALNQF